MNPKPTVLGPKAGTGETRAKVAALASRGHSVRQIAEELGVTTQAVYQHLERIRRATTKKASA